MSSPPAPSSSAHASAPADYASTAWQPSVFLGLNPDGSVIIVAHRSEMGTGAASSLPMLLADELDADWKRVRVEQALGDTKYGSQNTDGSCSIRDFYDAMRIAGATARTMLESAAAAKWGVAASECKAQMNTVVHTSSGKKVGFGELVAAASKLPVPDKAALKFKSAADFKYIGKDLPMVDRTELTTGKGIYGIDAKMPGMLVAMIERPRSRRQSRQELDDAEARKVKLACPIRRRIDRVQGRRTVSAARRCRCARQQHLVGDAGAQEAEDRMAGKRQRRVTTATASKPQLQYRAQAW
jgi:isoquinoline 1-oxidoreductase subunit beta